MERQIPKHIFRFHKSVRKGTKTQYEKQAKDIIGLEKNKYKWILNIGKDAHSLVIREMEIKATLRYNISCICMTMV